MSSLVPATDIERIVGVERHQTEHYARAVSKEQTVYILHSADCLRTTPDLRECPWSLALDRGIDPDEWVQDAPVKVRVRDGLLVPGRPDAVQGDGPSW
jgi:hypothetical protein